MTSQKKPPANAKDGSATDKSSGDPAVRYGKIDSARMLGFSVRKLDYRIAQKKIRFTKDGNRIMISRSEILRYGKINDTDPVIDKPKITIVKPPDKAA